MQPRIVGIAGPFQGQTLPLPEGEVTLGRDHSSQLWSSDAALSRRHCAFVRTGNEVRLKDLASRNGTRVNSVPANEQLLRHGDQISVGWYPACNSVPCAEHTGDHEASQSCTGVDFVPRTCFVVSDARVGLCCRSRDGADHMFTQDRQRIYLFSILT